MMLLLSCASQKKATSTSASNNDVEIIKQNGVTALSQNTSSARKVEKYSSEVNTTSKIIPLPLVDMHMMPSPRSVSARTALEFEWQ